MVTNEVVMYNGQKGGIRKILAFGAAFGLSLIAAKYYANHQHAKDQKFLDKLHNSQTIEYRVVSGDSICGLGNSEGLMMDGRQFDFEEYVRKLNHMSKKENLLPDHTILIPDLNGDRCVGYGINKKCAK